MNPIEKKTTWEEGITQDRLDRIAELRKTRSHEIVVVSALDTLESVINDAIKVDDVNQLCDAILSIIDNYDTLWNSYNKVKMGVENGEQFSFGYAKASATN